MKHEKELMDALVAGAVPFLPQEEPDYHRNAPRPDPACLYGLVGDIARAGAGTEANPYAIAANAMAYLSCAVGRGPYMPVGNVWHHARLFTLHVGRSSLGRKGDAMSLLLRISDAVKTLDEHASPQIHRGGLSSGEGLVHLIHDGYTDGTKEVPPIHDKRLWAVESEFANVLYQSKRTGNTLSTALRDCWDGVSMRPATKTNRVHASDPHVCLSGAITPSELRSQMAARDMTNGFANRFLVLWAERTQLIPFPRPASQAVIDGLAARIMEVLTFCGAARWVDKNTMRVELSPDARARYAELYTTELNVNTNGDRIAALVERRAPMLLRMAMLFALTDLTKQIEVHHVDAALAWVRYSGESVKFIFASAVDEDQAAQTHENAQRIVGFLQKKRSATRTQISSECFKSHTPKDAIDAALDELLTATPPLVEVETLQRPKGSPGTPTKVYRLVGANSAKSASCEAQRGAEAQSSACEMSETSQLSATDGTTVRTICTVREPSSDPQTHASIDVSHNSQISHVEEDRKTE